MNIGIVKENKVLEGRVAVIPADCAELVMQGHSVFIETGAGHLSGYNDEDYQSQGVKLCASAAELYKAAELIVKVKEPIEQDLQYLQQHHTLFCYLHLAANLKLTQQLCDIGLTAIAFETVSDEAGRLPLLKPMSEIAGTLSVHIGTQLLHQPQGGKGLMLGGLSLPDSAFTDKGHVVVLGAGVAGRAAVRQAVALGADVTVIDRSTAAIESMMHDFPGIQGLESSEAHISQAVKQADLLVGAVLLPGLQAPRLVTEAQVKTMQFGSVIVDISVDQGGCIETIHATNYAQPTYRLHEVLHFGVTNMPGAVPRTASQALSSTLLPYLLTLSGEDWRQNQALLDGVNIRQGRIDNPLIDQAIKAYESI